MSAIRALNRLPLARLSAVARPARAAPFRAAFPRSLGVSSLAMRGFGSSARRSSDTLLVQKLADELKFERGAVAEVEDAPEFLTKFKTESGWSVEDVAGNDEVTLTRQYGGETLRLMFSIADIQQAETPEEMDEEMGDVPTPAVAFPIRASLAVTKKNAQGSLNIDTVCQQGTFLVDNISFYPDGKLGTDLTAEADWRRRGLYIGPSFDTLDAGVQEEVEKWLAARGVDETMASFIPEYAEFKEQKEYVQWLDNVKNFVEA